MIAGRYTLGRELGRGGMGAVYLARDEVLGREVAIKRIGMVPGATSPDLARAEREARLAAQLNHPHVVSVFDLVEDQDHQWLVMEYVEGESLAERIRGGGLDHAEAARIMRQVADGLAQAHRAGITHRDVKPSNILVTADGQAKLTDFGIARSQTDVSLTQTGLVTGSPAYLAPEIASGAGAGTASDVWSLGATLFHVLAGRPPYDVSANLIGGLYKIVHEDPPRLTDAGAFDELLRATMAKEPAERWPMERVRDRLAEICRDPSAAGVTSTLVETPLVETRETPSATEVLAQIAPASIAPAPPAGVEKRNRSPWPWLAGAIATALAIILVITLTGDDPDDPASDASTSEPTSEPTSDAPTTQAANTRRDITEFITTYLTTVTTDRRATYALLTPEFQAESGGFQGYNGFWRNIASAEATNIEVDPESLTVSYDVAYRTVSGDSSNDSVTLQLQRTDDGYLIAGEA